MGRIYVTSAAIRKKQNSSCQCFLQFLGSNANINSDGTEAEIVINKVAVVQQHCGGGQISLFQGELKAGGQ